MPTVIMQLLILLIVLLISLLFVNHSIDKENHQKQYENDPKYKDLKQELNQAEIEVRIKKNALKRYQNRF